MFPLHLRESFWLLLGFLIAFTTATQVYALGQIDPAVGFNTSFNAGFNFNETANFTSMGIDGGSILFTGPDGTANFNISTALNLSFRHTNASKQLNITLNRLFWDNSSGIVNATVRGLGSSQSVKITQPNGTNITQTADASGVAILYWAGTQNITNFTYTEDSDTTLPNITHLSPANLTLREVPNATIEVNASDDRGLNTVVVDFGGVNVTNSSGLVNGSNFVTITGLNDGNVTYYTVVNDTAGNKNATAKRIITVDTKNATLSNIKTQDVTSQTANVLFDADRNVSAIVSYGTQTGNYTVNYTDNTLSASKTLSLVGLDPVKTYYYIIYAYNRAGNLTVSTEYNFTTPVAGGSSGSSGGPGGGPRDTVTTATSKTVFCPALNAFVNESRYSVGECDVTENLSVREAKIFYVLPASANPFKKAVCSSFFGAFESCRLKEAQAGIPVEFAGGVFSTLSPLLGPEYGWVLSSGNRTVSAFSGDVVTVRIGGPGAYTMGFTASDRLGGAYAVSYPFTVVTAPVEEAAGPEFGQAFGSGLRGRIKADISVPSILDLSVFAKIRALLNAAKARILGLADGGIGSAPSVQGGAMRFSQNPSRITGFLLFVVLSLIVFVLLDEAHRISGGGGKQG